MKDHAVNDKGMTLLEIVSAVGIVIIFAAVGFSMYGSILDGSKQAAVERAADAVYNKAYAYLLDGDDKTDPFSVDDEYNLSQGKEQNIITDVRNLGNNRIKVTAFMSDYTAVRITPGGNSGNNSTNPDDDNTNVKPPVIGEDTLTNFSYQCNEDRVGYLPILNIDEYTKVYMWETGNKNATFKEVNYDAPNSAMINAGDDFLREVTREEMARTKILVETNGDWDKVYETVGGWNPTTHTAAQKEAYSVANTVQNVSQQVTLKANVKYSVMYDGDVETFAAPGNKAYSVGGNTGIADCLTSIDNLGNSTNLKNILYIGGEKLVNVPDTIPSTVMNLRGAFENSTRLNDPSISKWNVSNVISIRSMFYNATSFNQPLNEWDTSNVVVAHMAFRLAKSFNQDLSSWDTSSIQYMDSMFYDASSFNNGCPQGVANCALTWRIDNLISAPSMFANATSFNQSMTTQTVNGVTYWDMSKVSTITSMFKNATSFNNGDVAGQSNKPLNWDLSSMSSFSTIFNNASSFNQDTKQWIIVNMTNKNVFHSGSGLLCSNVHPRLLTNNQCIAG